MSEPAAPSQRSSSAALLWTSAFIIGALIVVQLGRMAEPRGGAGVALAELPMGMGGMPAESVSRVGDYTVMTFNAGSDDVLAILDGRGEELFTYRVKNLNQFEFLGREKLPEMFATARRIGPGRK